MARFSLGRTGARSGDPDGETWPGGAQPRTGPPVALPATAGAPGRLQGNESWYAYLAGAVVVVSSLLLLTHRTGTGVKGHPGTTWAVLGVAGGVAMMVSVRWRNRLATASLALLAGLAVSRAPGPNSLAGVRTTGFFIPAVFALLVYIRQSRADRARRSMERSGSSRSPGGRGGKGAPDPAATKGAGGVIGGRGRPSGRYTPPKDRIPPPPKSTGRRTTR